MIIQFDLGDWSGDGHERGFPVFMESSLSSDALAELYLRASEELGFVLHERVCYDYANRVISAKDLTFLAAHVGYVSRNDNTFHPDWIYPEDVFAMFVAILRWKDPDLLLTQWEPDEVFFRSGDKNRSFSLAYGTF